jgi:hypothetical protein
MKTAHGLASQGLTHRTAAHKQTHPHSVAIAKPPREGEVDPDRPFEEGAHDEIDSDLRHRLISEAAFDLYAKRGFVDGYDLEDRLTAEASIDHLLLNPQFAT